MHEASELSWKVEQLQKMVLGMCLITPSAAEEKQEEEEKREEEEEKREEEEEGERERCLSLLGLNWSAA
jgi:hypothetical protein